VPQLRFEVERPKYKSQVLLLESTCMARQQARRIEKIRKLQSDEIMAQRTSLKFNHFGMLFVGVRKYEVQNINPLNTELNPICQLYK